MELHRRNPEGNDELLRALREMMKSKSFYDCLAALVASKRTTAWMAGPFPSSFLLTAEHVRIIHQAMYTPGILN